MSTKPVKPLRFLLPLLVLGAAFLIAPAAASAAAHLKDTWCSSTTACMAVGASDIEDGEPGASQVHVKRWNGSAWTVEEVDPPEGAVTSALEGAHCSSATVCTAVGSYVDEEAEATLALAMRWNGSTWTIADLPKPAGALGSELVDLICTPTTCLAVGSYTDSEEVRKSMSLYWNGSVWSLLSVPIPSGAGLSELEGISCAAANDCVAVGSFVNSAEVTKTLALSWDGSSWSIASTPEPAGAELNQLYDVSCRPGDACTAVGTYFDSSGDQKTLALRRNTSKEWSIQTTPNKANALSRTLTAVACPSTTSCMAMGIVEQGRREVPIALGWNGTTWSEQSIDTEALGAAVVKPEGVFCGSTTSCEAVGSVSYGRSAARRNLAFHFNGTSWSVSEAGGYEREWTTVDVSDATSNLRSISCFAAHRCVAVGNVVDDSGFRRTQFSSWDGGSWESDYGPTPDEAGTSELTGVSCVSAMECWAVGSYIDKEGKKELLVLRGNGTEWSIVDAASPAGSLGAELLAVDCPSAGSCTAVGSQVDEAGTQVPLALSLDGDKWAPMSLSSSSAVASGLSAVSCPTNSSCLAVGGEIDAFGHEQSVAISRSGSVWTSLDPPAVEDNLPNGLKGVSCTSSTQCVLVGSFEDQQGSEQGFAFDWDGEDLEAMEIPNGGEASVGGLTAVSCPQSTSCLAVGARPGDSDQPPILMRWDGDSWIAEPPATYPIAASAIGLGSISCYSETECHAAGSVSYQKFPAESLVLSYSDDEWFVADTASGGGGLRGVSCSSAGNCLAAGDSTEPAGDAGVGWGLLGDGWTAVGSAESPSAYLTDVACMEEQDCIAVGRKGAWPFRPLAESWDGEAWSAQSLPAPAGRSTNLEGVSCSSSSWCVAAGFSWPSAGAGAASALVETWNGTSWQIVSLSPPSGATSSFLHDVSCISASICIAAGSYTDSAGVHHGLIQSWNGTSWNALAITAPSGESYRFNGIDCTATPACTAVGTSTSTSDGSVSAYALRWNGSSLTPQSVPVAEGSTGAALHDVDCYSSTACVAVGRVTDPAGSQPLVAAWSAGGWELEDAPRVAGAELESVSCPSAGDCVAVGIAQSPGAPREPLAIQTKGEDPESEDPEPVGVTDPQIKLTAEQQEDALDVLTEDAAFQAAMGAATFEAQVGAWTEIDENGESVLVGAYVEVLLDEQESWGERTWPTAGYDLGRYGYLEGTHTASSIEASASDIKTLQINLDLEFDGSEHVVSGEAVEMVPLPTGSGSLDLDPESYDEFSKAVAGY